MKSHLEHFDQFQAILNDYQISDAGIDLLKRTKLVLLTSPTSSGRNTMIKELVKTGEYEYIVSDTTRSKRVNNGTEEQDGVEYWFRSEEEVLDDLKNGLFLEADIIHAQQVSGISLRELEKASNHDKIAINEIYYVGIDNVKKVKPDAHILFVLPPSYDEWMSRLLKRGDMSTEEVKRRLQSAELELESTVNRDYYKFVVNDDLEQAVKDVQRIVEEDKYTDEEHEAGKDLAWNLLSRVKQQLYS